MHVDIPLSNAVPSRLTELAVGTLFHQLPSYSSERDLALAIEWSGNRGIAFLTGPNAFELWMPDHDVLEREFGLARPSPALQLRLGTGQPHDDAHGYVPGTLSIGPDGVWLSVKPPPRTHVRVAVNLQTAQVGASQGLDRAVFSDWQLLDAAGRQSVVLAASPVGRPAS